VTAFFISALVLSGLTALPIAPAFQLAASVLGEDFAVLGFVPGLAEWLTRVYQGVRATRAQAPFIFYGTDWLAFGHLVVATAFIGAWRDPVRNRWLFRFGMIACAMVIPWAMGFGAIRGIPFGWRLLDCAFGVVGFVPVWLAGRWAGQLEGMSRHNALA